MATAIELQKTSIAAKEAAEGKKGEKLQAATPEKKKKADSKDRTQTPKSAGRGGKGKKNS